MSIRPIRTIDNGKNRIPEYHKSGGGQGVILLRDGRRGPSLGSENGNIGVT